MWDYTADAYATQARRDPVWVLERLISVGLGSERLDRALLEQYLTTLRIPEDRRAFLELLLWDRPF